MAIAPIITFDDPAGIPAFVRLSQLASSRDIRLVMGRAVATMMRKYFTKLDRERPNKLGGDRTHFYGQVRRSVQQPTVAGSEGIEISINQVGIAQRYFGGYIRPRAAKFLTIPVHPVAYGHRAREFSDLVAVFFQDGSGILERPNYETDTHIGEVYYRLVRKVYQDPDPTVLPPENEMRETAVMAAGDMLQTITERLA